MLRTMAVLGPKRGTSVLAVRGYLGGVYTFYIRGKVRSSAVPLLNAKANNLSGRGMVGVFRGGLEGRSARFGVILCGE